MSTLAGAAVALVILADIATGQGPQALNNYLAVLGGPDYRAGQPPIGVIPPPPQAVIVYPPAGEYDDKRPINTKEEKEYLKEKEKPESFRPSFGPGYLEKTTTAPGVLTSFSNSMSDAWKSLTALGRQTREVREKRAVKDDKLSQPDSKSAGLKSSARSMDEYEWKQFNNQGYMYLKVPRALVCGGSPY